MKPERWQKIEQIHNGALERKPDEQRAFLNDACAGDVSLRKEVESLIACQCEVGNFIESSALKAAADRSSSQRMRQAPWACPGLQMAIGWLLTPRIRRSSRAASWQFPSKLASDIG